jgi:hypothetical protein
MELQGESLVWPFMWFTSVNISCMLLHSRLDNALPMYFGQLFAENCGLFISYFISGWVNTFSVLPHVDIVTSLQRSVITSGIGHQSLESVTNMSRGHVGKHEHMGMDILRKGQRMCSVGTFFFIRLQSKWVCVLSWVHVLDRQQCQWELGNHPNVVIQ